MKNLYRIAFMMSALSALTACQGNLDPEGDVIPEEFVGPYTLVADKTEVEASGADYVTFSILDAYERDILKDKKALQKVNIISDVGSVRVARLEKTIRFIANGEYVFSAKYNGEKCANTVEISVKNREKYEVFHKNVAIYKATATWCGPCAVMTKALEGRNAEAKRHSVELCWHAGDNFTIGVPGYTNDCGALIATRWGGGGVPTVIMDLHSIVEERNPNTISNMIWDIRADYPATCGIKLDTDWDAAESKLSVAAELCTSKGGTYELGFAILLNNQIYEQGTNEGGKYTHIVCAATDNFIRLTSAAEAVAKDGRISRTMSVTLPDNMAIKNFSVVAFALIEDGKNVRIDNIVEVDAGKSIDYQYND